MPSGPPDEPARNVRRAHLTSSGLTWRGVKRVLPVGSIGQRRSGAGPGCLLLLLLLLLRIIMIIIIIIIIIKLIFFSFARQHKACRLENC